MIDYDDCVSEMRDLIDQRDAARAEVARLTEALTWYGDAYNYQLDGSVGEWEEGPQIEDGYIEEADTCEWVCDGGARARAALAATAPKEEAK